MMMIMRSRDDADNDYNDDFCYLCGDVVNHVATSEALVCWW